MNRAFLTSALLASAITLTAATVTSPAFAADDMKSGKMMMMIGPDGKEEMLPMPDKAKLDMMMKYAKQMDEKMIILVWGNRTYLINDAKMDDGKMMFNAWQVGFSK